MNPLRYADIRKAILLSMNKKSNLFLTKNWRDILFYAVVLAAMLFFVFLQPLGEPPDESGRYKIVQYICLNGTLPHGADADIILFGYGGSYGFQPILTYMIQGYLLRFLFQFCQDGYLLLLAARLVNVVFGMIMAIYVRKIAKLLFQDQTFGWLFSVMVMLLPQSIFLHTYVNTDSMAMMSSAIMVYAWLTGLKKNWDLRSCVTLAIGISLCALSYYNAYGFILCSILLFALSFVKKDQTTGKLSVDYRSLFQKGIFISAIVLLCIGWWFLRNAFLYDGDFLGLRAREECTRLTATAQYHPLTKETYQNQGYSLWYMLFHSDFLTLLFNSTVATFGPMSIVTYQHIYAGFKVLLLLAGLSCILIPARFVETDKLPAQRPCLLLRWNLLLCILIPVLLCVFYSYASDYQPQGRYILPMLLPLCYFLTDGVRKLTLLAQRFLPPLKKLPQIVTALLSCYYLYALWITLLCVVFPVYYETSILYYIRH